jgi:predicted GIY-YIG superfamily endonuclease
MGGVEYVGETIRPKRRFYQHIKKRPLSNSRHSKFYGRQDLSMHVVDSFETKEEAKNAEYHLQIYWNLKTDKQKHLEGNRNKPKQQAPGNIKNPGLA